MSDALAITPRALQRRCETVLGKSPLAYFQDLRVERAQALLHGSGLDIEAIAVEVSYEDGATLRTLLRRRLEDGCGSCGLSCVKAAAQLNTPGMRSKCAAVPRSRAAAFAVPSKNATASVKIMRVPASAGRNSTVARDSE